MNTSNGWKKEFIDGAKECIPIVVVIIPMGALFGATAITSGLTPLETFFSSLVMYTAAAQFLFLEINGYNVPAWSIILAVFAVAFRHLLYSATITKKIVGFSPFQKIAAFALLSDPSFASLENRSETQNIHPSYYFGYALPIYIGWVLMTIVGIYFGSLIEDPKRFGIDFIIPIYFLILLMGFRKRPSWLHIVLASGISSVILFQLIGPPWHISLGALFGIGIAMILPSKKHLDSADDQ